MSIILLSIRPEYVKPILLGQKKYEFRKRIPDEKVDAIVIYETRPAQRIVAIANVLGIISDSPKRLWEKTSPNAGIDYKAYSEYFGQNVKAFAYKLGELQIFEKGVELSEIGIFQPPQSYYYLSEEQTRVLLSKKFTSTINDNLEMEEKQTGIHNETGITSCTITWDNWGLASADSILQVKTKILSEEIQVRFYTGFGLQGGSIWPLTEEQRSSLFGLLEECRREWDKDDYSIPVCDGSHWQLKICSKGRCLKTIEGTVELPPRGDEIKAILKSVIGTESCFF